MRQCPNCHSEAATSAKFCTQCGTPLDELSQADLPKDLSSDPVLKPSNQPSTEPVAGPSSPPPGFVPPPPPTQRPATPPADPVNVDLRALGRALKPSVALVGILLAVAGVLSWPNLGGMYEGFGPGLRAALGGLAAVFSAATTHDFGGAVASMHLLGVAALVAAALYYAHKHPVEQPFPFYTGVVAAVVTAVGAVASNGAVSSPLIPAVLAGVVIGVTLQFSARILKFLETTITRLGSGRNIFLGLLGASYVLAVVGSLPTDTTGVLRYLDAAVNAPDDLALLLASVGTEDWATFSNQWLIGAASALWAAFALAVRKLANPTSSNGLLRPALGGVGVAIIALIFSAFHLTSYWSEPEWIIGGVIEAPLLLGLAGLAAGGLWLFWDKWLVHQLPPSGGR